MREGSYCFPRFCFFSMAFHSEKMSEGSVTWNDDQDNGTFGLASREISKGAQGGGGSGKGRREARAQRLGHLGDGICNLR